MRFRLSFTSHFLNIFKNFFHWGFDWETAFHNFVLLLLNFSFLSTLENVVIFMLCWCWSFASSTLLNQFSQLNTRFLPNFTLNVQLSSISCHSRRRNFSRIQFHQSRTLSYKPFLSIFIFWLITWSESIHKLFLSLFFLFCFDRLYLF